ncbi:hypothetical protein M404DRAFT_1008326 [Pisolithus tinctorius Marx 270]|uniref:Uncharacterized protein n=1 Tax=Pisolithus tinctorius Marx 270 TaxID=870435 RepID=A0A0C3MZX8_PISTI|nr:hypothetical protein M404DRAFT_1008326 [Pisolithus tinctorius Marx 270]
MLLHRLNDLNQGVRSQTCAPDEQAKRDFLVDYLILDNVSPGTQRRSHDAYFPSSLEMVLCLHVNSIPPELCLCIAA